MSVPVAHPAAVDDERVIEERTVAVRRRLQSLEEFREERHVIGVQLRVPGDLVRLVVAFVLTTGFFALDMALFQPRYLGLFRRLLHPHMP